ncbi:UNVERIFIED_CONTAM: hypothetical protein Sradi_2096200 [Sesamum radiatum]|uniref:HTH merR-type domain-containing protein n=1 Tax=Sesamum radiatum TaxID=300843 RepID=A0AAW2TJD7_SESRA
MQVALQTLNLGMSLKDIVKFLALTTQQLQQDSTETKASLQHIRNQISQLAMRMEKLGIQAFQEQSSQTETHPVENMSTMTLRGEKELHIIEQAPMEIKENEETLEDTEAQDKMVESDLILRLIFVFFLLPTGCPN